MIGQVVGNYQITEQLGEGGMCVVYKAVDLMQHGAVALKMLRPEFARQPHTVDRFCTEAVTLAKLNHPHIAAVHSFFRQGDEFFIVMEYVPGETLDQVIRKSGAMCYEQASPLFCQVLEGIDYAHQFGIVHRDIKPGNIMLTETGSIKVMDFGIARISGMARITRDGTLIGTFEYMSPEQILGQQIDARSDIYSLGILLYEWLTGRLPFVSHNDYELLRSHVEETPTPPRDLVPQIPVQVEAAILRALAKAPEARFQTAGEFRMVLETSRFSTEPTLDNQMPGDATPVIGKSEMLMSPDGRQVCGEISPLMKETRQGPADWAPPTDERSTVLSIPIEPGAAQRPAPPANKLHWKQWVSAAAAMFVLVSVVVGLVNRRNTSVTPPPPPPLASPPQTAVVPPPPATQPPVADSVDMKDMLNQPSPPPNPSPAQTAAKSPPRTGTPPHGRKSPAAKNSDPHQQEKVPLENVERRDSQGQKTASAERHDPQEEKKGSKIGGFFRKVGGGVKKVGQMITGGDENPKDTDRAPVDEQKKEKP